MAKAVAENIRDKLRLLLWVIEGRDYMRAHAGTCYLYDDDGAFVPYKGVPPEATFARVRDYLLQLEGIFRTFPEERVNVFACKET